MLVHGCSDWEAEENPEQDYLTKSTYRGCECSEE